MLIEAEASITIPRDTWRRFFNLGLGTILYHPFGVIIACAYMVLQ